LAGSSHHLPLSTKVGFLVGWLFFALAFLLAAAEAVTPRDGLFTSANDLLVALSPGKWIAFKARFDSVLLDFVTQTFLRLPGWLLAGLPAGFLIWTCRPHREDMDPDLYDSLTTYDRLAEMADEAGAEDDDPTYQEYHISDYEDDWQPDDIRSAAEYMKNWHPEDVDDDPALHSPKGPDDRMQDARDKLPIPFDKLS